jgi:damage-control phosphatase, subfamily I
MVMDKRCIECARRSQVRVMDKYGLSTERRKAFLSFFDEWVQSANGTSPLEVGQHLRAELERITGIADPYSEEKRAGNHAAMQLYHEFKPLVFQSEDPFNMALRLAVAGNIMDYGASERFDIHQTIRKVLHADFAIDHSQALLEKIRQASAVLYLGDNAGEIVFDKLLIEVMQHPDVTFVVRGAPVINDVTLEDAAFTGMHNVAKVISNGHNAPSTLPEKSSPEFRSVFEKADLIISKGQGNLEGLWDRHDSRIFFLLMAKCQVFAELLGVPEQSFIVYNRDALVSSELNT